MDDILESKTKVGFISNLALFLCLYLYIFSPRLDFGFSIHTGYFVVFLVFVFGLPFLVKALTNKSIIFVGCIFLFLAAFHFLMASFYLNDPFFFLLIQLSLIAYLIFGFVVAAYLSSKVVSLDWKAESLVDKLIKLSAFAVFINSAIILIEYLNPEIKEIVESILINDPGANINYGEHAFRLRGFAAAGGAGLSIVNALTVLFFIFLTANKQVSSSLALLCSLVIVVSNIFTGRTGLLFGILFFLVLLLFAVGQLARSGIYSGIRSLGLILLFGFSMAYIFNFDLDPAAAGWAFEWVDGLKSGEIDSTSVDELKSMLFVPDNPMHLLFGIGFFEGDNSLYPRSDSGYLKTIFSIGVPLGIVLYSAIIFLFFRLCGISKKYCWLVWSILAFMLFVEVKEPFLYQNFAARVIFLLSGAALFSLGRRHKC